MRSTLRISRVATQIAALFALTSCALLIPDNPSAPRYEVALGERRVPLENPGGSGAMQRSRAAAMATQQMQMAQAYPNLNNVPPAPSRGDEAQRLMQTRQGLEQQRGITNGARNQLLNDAAAEPSMLSDMPQPPAYPAQPYPPLTYPVPAVAPMQQPVAPAYAPHSGLPSTDVITGGPSASSLAGPTPQLAQLPPPIAMDSLPMGGYGGAAAPMQLQQPGAMTTASFDPMANGAMNLTPPGGSSVGSAAGYLSPSRYRR